MANVPNPEFRKLWSSQIKFLRLEYGKTAQRPDAEARMERVHGALLSQRDSEMESNHAEHDEGQEESLPITARMAAVKA
jgi:hypothetical protein